MNLGFGSKDQPDCLQQNRALIESYFNAPLFTAYQHHSADVFTIDEITPQFRPKADALVTTMPNIVIGVLTADCVPILLIEPDIPVIAAVHAGWQGCYKGVIANAIRAMLDLGADLAKIKAAVGPAIAQTSYEIDATFKQRMLDRYPFSESLFIAGRDKTHFYFNLPALAIRLLQQSELTQDQIHHIDQDSYQLEAQFFSYRRATHRNEPDYGRQLSAICLKI